MFDQARGVLKQRVYSLAAAVTGTGAQAGVGIKPQTGVVTGVITIAAGSARSAQFEISFDGTNYIPVGTARTATGSFAETIPAAPKIRLNIASNTGSTISAQVYG